MGIVIYWGSWGGTIHEDKYLLADLNYKNGYDKYKNGKIFFVGYTNDPIYNNERYISSGEIKSIKGFEFEHSIDTRKGSYGAPICLIENLRVINLLVLSRTIIFFFSFIFFP